MFLLVLLILCKHWGASSVYLFFLISTYRLSSDDNLGSEGHAGLGQDLLLHVPVIVDSSISYFRGENGVGLERQLLINLQKF